MAKKKVALKPETVTKTQLVNMFKKIIKKADDDGLIEINDIPIELRQAVNCPLKVDIDTIEIRPKDASVLAFSKEEALYIQNYRAVIYYKGKVIFYGCVSNVS